MILKDFFFSWWEPIFFQQYKDQSARLQWFSLITFCTTISSKSLYESPYYFWKEVLWITKLCLVDLENGPRIVHMDTEESFDFWNRTFALTWFLPLEVSISYRSGSVESHKGQFYFFIAISFLYSYIGGKYLVPKWFSGTRVFG